MRITAACLALAVALPLSVAAQERPNTILVLDGSGSMWGQIDGINKIVIAREVVADILADFPADQNLGLTVYGHRERGVCTDIETIIEPGLDNRQAILDAVNAINPRGMTPMTDAVIAAADSLRYTEQAATVILVSDGIETCAPDPCAAARALEEAGIGFTAHVVGFDVTEAEALAQMQCLANETGGLFLSAANADELATALQTVVQAEPPAPTSFEVTFTARRDTGEDLSDRVVWDVILEESEVASEAPGPLAVELADGRYTAVAYLTEEERSAEVSFQVLGSAQVVEVVFDTVLPDATLDAPDSVPAGSTILVGWTGPDDSGDNVQVGPLDGGYSDYSYTTDGNPAEIVAPAEPGTYELRYVFQDRVTIATRPITVTEAELALTAPDSVPAGSTIEVTWAGPNQPGDNIQIGEVGGGYSDYAYTADGNPVQLVAPAQPGTYELRYRFRDRETILTRPITVTDIAVSLTAPDSVMAGSTFQVTWTGPAADGDNIQVATVGGSWVTYNYVTAGNPLDLTAPGEPGTYELRYSFRDSETIAVRPITVTPVSAQVIAPPTAVAGGTVVVGWDGPGNAVDFIGIGPVGGGYETWAMIGDNPVEVPVPAAPGDYEVRYYLGVGETVVASTMLTVTAP